MSLRIAVLLTNDDTSACPSRFSNDGQKVVPPLQPLRPGWVFEVLPLKDGEWPSDPKAFHGDVITGSPASVNDNSLPWVGQLLDFICAVYAARQPLIGLFFGCARSRHRPLASSMRSNAGQAWQAMACATMTSASSDLLKDCNMPPVHVPRAVSIA